MENNKNILGSKPLQSADSNNQSPPPITAKETRQIVTPYAFFVADSLLGTRLAGPYKRGMALTIDLIFVALLTKVSSLILATVAAATFFRAGNRLKTKKRYNAGRLFLRLIVAFLLFVIAVGIVDEINKPESKSNDAKVSAQQIEKLAVVGITAQYLIQSSALLKELEQGECTPKYACIKTLGEQLIDDTVGARIGNEGVAEAIETYIEVMSGHLTVEEQTQLLESLKALSEVKAITETDPDIPNDLEKVISDYVEDETEKESLNTSPKGIVDWLKDLIEELGLGFGWAAFYFSVFTAWWRGQTPGKKIMGIQVVKLDNQALNLWESFGRYGGYGAGLATGLLGFLQIFWDPNRQAIQDKISETLVIDLRYPKVTLGTSENEQE
ncbi:MAG: RDD family protein [Paraglaciecola sp.]|uniref:RDD family protein n=1 Tax=Paraglaciecola sp. TaxID=1920173 RepID=UPI0032977F8C